MLIMVEFGLVYRQTIELNIGKVESIRENSTSIIL